MRRLCVAYQKLGVLTLAALVVFSVGCGGDTTSSGSSGNTAEQQPPASGEQPPTNKDQPPGSTDKPPSSSDTPPGSADAPAGSGCGSVDICKKFCTAFDDAIANCSMDADAMSLGDLCPKDLAGCQVPASTPCVHEAVDFFDCALSIVTDICQSQSEPQAADPLAKCKDTLDGLNSCTQAQGTPEPKPGKGNNGSGGGSSASNCSPA